MIYDHYTDACLITAARVARIYNREGILQNTSEPVDRLEHVLDWRYAYNIQSLI